MNNKPEIIDSLFVYQGESRSLGDYLGILDQTNAALGKIPKKYRTAETKLSLFKETISNSETGTLYRQRQNAASELVTYWLSKIKKISYIYGILNNTPKFEGITEDEIRYLVTLSQNAEDLFKLENILAEKGIILVIEPALPNMKTDGAVFVNHNGHAVVAISLRYNRLDNFWFTLVHELAHLCIHKNELSTPIIEDLDSTASSLIEKQADRLAKELMIPKHIWRNCRCQYDRSEHAVRTFASEISIHPSIVAGRLNYELNNYKLFKSIIFEYDVKELLGI